MAVGSIGGGFLGAHAGSRIKPLYVRIFVICVGLLLSLHFYLEAFAVRCLCVMSAARHHA